jgi:hypothetical protein
VLDFITKELGVDEKTLGTLWHTNPVLRSGAFQKLAYMATAYAIARDSVSKRGADPHIPRVFTPGEAVTSGADHSALAAAFRAFAQDSNPRTAAKALQARRKAASGLR